MKYTFINKLLNYRQSIKIFFEAKQFIKQNKLDLERNNNLDNIENGKECYILGNGPSLKNLDFSKLKNIDLITVNQIARLKNFSTLKIKYHFWVDPMFFKKVEDSDDLYNYMKLTILNSKNTIFFVGSNSKNTIVKKLLTLTNKVYFYPIFNSCESGYKYKGSLHDCCPNFANVIQCAIYSAICLGYKKIYLLGCDQTGIFNVLAAKTNQQSNCYGYPISKSEQIRMQNHFKNTNISIWLSQNAKMFKDFDWIESFSKTKNCKIYNCTNNSLCDSFEFKKI